MGAAQGAEQAYQEPLCLSLALVAESALSSTSGALVAIVRIVCVWNGLLTAARRASCMQSTARSQSAVLDLSRIPEGVRKSRTPDPPARSALASTRQRPKGATTGLGVRSGDADAEGRQLHLLVQVRLHVEVGASVVLFQRLHFDLEVEELALHRVGIV